MKKQSKSKHNSKVMREVRQLMKDVSKRIKRSHTKHPL